VLELIRANGEARPRQPINLRTVKDPSIATDAAIQVGLAYTCCLLGPIFDDAMLVWV